MGRDGEELPATRQLGVRGRFVTRGRLHLLRLPLGSDRGASLNVS